MLENLFGATPLWLFLFISGVMYFSLRPRQLKSKKHAKDSLFSKLNRRVYRKPYPSIPSLTNISAEELPILKDFEFFQQYVNYHLPENFVIEQIDQTFATLFTYDMPNEGLVFKLFKGDFEVGDVEVVPQAFIEGKKWARINVSLKYAHCFNFKVVYSFFKLFSDCHEGNNNPDKKIIDEQILYRLTQRLWDNVTDKNDMIADGHYVADQLNLEKIEMCFEGNYLRLTQRLNYWKKNKIKPSDLEDKRFKRLEELDGYDPVN
jgi:hypothetical protein